MPAVRRLKTIERGRALFQRGCYRSAVMGLTLVLVGGAGAQSPQAGTIRVWGHGHRGRDYIKTLMTAWEEGFRKTHPGVRFENDLYGDASGMGSLYTGTGDLAVLDREASFIEVDAYQQGTGYDPFRIAVARGAVSLARHAPALKVYVSKENPLTHVTMAQLDGIFDADHRIAKQAIATWGDLGLTGEWAGKSIHLYTPNIESAEMQFFERAAMKGSQKFSCCLKLYAERTGMSADAQVIAAVSKDNYGLALASEAAPGLKELALAASDSAAPVLATAGSIGEGTYPLARTVYVYVNRKPKTAISAELKAFLEYVVSEQGQALVRAGGYLPLSAGDAAKAREALQ